MTRRPALRDRIVSGILDTAAEVLAERGEAASMAEIAEAAGVGRATLYRYFPSREALLAGLAGAAFEDLIGRIEDAELDTVPVAEGIARLTRSFVAAGRRYTALMRAKQTAGRKDVLDPAEVDRGLTEPVRELLRRGAADGTLRTDLPVEILVVMFTGLLEKALELVTRERLGVEQAAAAVIGVFLNGAIRAENPAGR
jgi:AcrR family transcriptional regulator